MARGGMPCGSLGQFDVLQLAVKVGQDCGAEPSGRDIFAKVFIMLYAVEHPPNLHVGQKAITAEQVAI